MMNLSNQNFEKIYNNFLENCYLKILMATKSKKASLDIISETIEKILVYNYQFENLITIINKMTRYALRLIKDYVISHKSEIDNVDLDKLDYSIPKQIYLLNFDAFKLFNETDNLILMDLTIYRLEVKDLTNILDCDASYIIDRYNQMIRQIRIIYLEKVKYEFI